MIERVVHLGFEVRVDLVRDDGEKLSVQLTRDEAERLELEPRQIVYVRPTRQTTFTQLPDRGPRGEQSPGRGAKGHRPGTLSSRGNLWGTARDPLTRSRIWHCGWFGG